MANLKEEWAQKVLHEIEGLGDRIREIENITERNARSISDILTNRKNKSNGTGGSNGTLKGIGIIGLIITVLVGLVAIGEYMGRENEYIRKDLVRSEEYVGTLAKTLSEVAKVQSGILVTFREVETQFTGLREVITLQQKFNEFQHVQTNVNLNELEDWIVWWNKNMGPQVAAQGQEILNVKSQIKSMQDRMHEMSIHDYQTFKKDAIKYYSSGGESSIGGGD